MLIHIGNQAKINALQGALEETMGTRSEILIIDTDISRIKSLRKVLRDARPDVEVDEISEVRKARDGILMRRPMVVLLHSTFPYIEEGGRGLLELIQEDFRNSAVSVVLVLPLSGSLLYRSGYQPGMEMLDMADDIVTTDFTSDMIQSVVMAQLDRRQSEEKAYAVEGQTVSERRFAFVAGKNR